MNRKASWIGTFILSIILLFIPISSTWGNEIEPATIKVGYYEDGDYMSRNQQGEYVGYNIEYLQEISKQSGLRFDIIDAVSWNAAYDMLVRGEIDLLPAVYYSDQRADEILFSGQPMCSIYTTLNVRMDDERYDFEDYDGFQGMQVGIIRDGVDGERFREFCREHELTLSIVNYDETSDLLAALDSGTLDGVAITHLGKNSTFRSVAQFSPSPLYFAVTKSNPKLLAELNRAMNHILLSNPGYGTDLYDKYLAPSINQTPVFTKEEREYINQAETVIVSYDPAFSPLSYQDSKTKEFKGVIADIFHVISESSGLHFQFEAHSQPEALELMKKGAIQIISMSDGDYRWDRKNGITSTLYYLRTPTSLVTQYNSETLESFALPQGYQLSEIIEAAYPDAKVQYYPSLEACLDAVVKGKADAVCMNTQVAGAYLSKAAYKNLRTATLGQYINEMCIGISSSEDTRLFSIVNKCIQYLPAEQVDASLVDHASSAKDISATEFLGQNIWPILGLVALIAGVIILLISYNLKTALRSNRRIQDLLYKDELTGQYNITGFYQKWKDNSIHTSQQHFALLYGDICQFKLINDNFGFETGNQVLHAYGNVIQDILQRDEFCGRISSDHFSIMLKYDTWELLLKRLHYVSNRLNQWRVEHTAIPYQIELIFGIYMIQPEDTASLHHKLDLANFARRYAKNSPGSFAILYDENMHNQTLMTQQLAGGLEKALLNDEFVVYYQPQVCMKDKTVIGSEALIRWNHPEKGFLAPGAFIPLFEKNGMVKKVDMWLFEDVCKTMHQWQAKGLTLLPVSCNFSRLHFQEEDFPEQVCTIADRWNIPHQLLELEITESALLEDSTTIEQMIPRLKAMDFRIAIDDFGSGYSSLGQLQQLTADVLKLDRSFVCHGTMGEREQIVIGHVIRMAGELGMTVICEGVETQTQSKTLQDIQCRYAQGYYFYRPMKLADYEHVIESQHKA